MWNYLDAINEGDGDAERYRQFCVGRARGLGRPNGKRLPAATAIGRQQTDAPAAGFLGGGARRRRRRSRIRGR